MKKEKLDKFIDRLLLTIGIICLLATPMMAIVAIILNT